MSDHCEQVFQVYSRLREHFGYLHPWWPGNPLEIALSAILVQRCEWHLAWSGIEGLRKARLVSVLSLAAADQDLVADCIEGVSFTQTKAGRLIRFAQGLANRGFTDIRAFLASTDTAALRNDLLSFDGVGFETADCILCFSGDHHPCFIADEYSRRAFERLGLFVEEASTWTYPRLRTFVETQVRAGLSLYKDFYFPSHVRREVALFRDFHAQLVELGRHHCLKDNPRCDSRGGEGWPGYNFCKRHCLAGACFGCPLRQMCQHPPQPPIQE